MSNIEKYFKAHILGSGGYAGGQSVRGIQTAASKVYNLSANENLLGTSPKAIQAIQKAVVDLNTYPAKTPIALQEALARYYKGALKSANFIIGNGGSELIDMAIRCFMDADSECIVCNPCFMPYPMFGRWSGGKVIDVPLNSTDYSINKETILGAITDKTRVLFLTSPNNPTGTYISKSDLDYLLDRIPKTVLVVYDEVYHHYVQAQDFTTAVSYIAKHENLLAINSFSKIYGLADIRLGYGYASEKLAFYLRKLGKPFYINSLNIAAGIAALEDEAFVGQAVDLVHQEKPKFYAKFEELGIKYWPSEANFIMIKPEIGEDEFVAKMLEQGVMVGRASLFGAPGCVRITIGTEEANAVCLAAMEAILTFS